MAQDIDKDIVKGFIESEEVKECFPNSLNLDQAAHCQCYPFINVKAAKINTANGNTMMRPI